MKSLAAFVLCLFALPAFGAEPKCSLVFHVSGLDQQKIHNKVGQITESLKPFVSEIESERIQGFAPVVRFPSDPEFQLLSNTAGVERIIDETETGKALFKVPEIKVVFLARDQSAVEKAYQTALESAVLHADLDLLKLWFTVNAYDCN